eukprot:m.144832 g.144832  ORF g.144832 m.144832 type:complete len:209 (+) comp13227_c0_seq14:1024-1650(+)
MTTSTTSTPTSIQKYDDVVLQSHLNCSCIVCTMCVYVFLLIIKQVTTKQCEEVLVHSNEAIAHEKKRHLHPTPFYIFDSEILHIHNLTHLTQPPAALRKLFARSSRGDIFSNESFIHQLFVGPRCSGSPLHVHHHAMNTLLSGQKQWWLLPPSKRTYTKLHPLLTPTTISGSPTCIQRQGDVILVPKGWTHATLNDAFVSGFAVELHP